MDRQNVWAPVGLVLDNGLHAAAKLVWLTLAQTAAHESVPLHTRAGVDRRTAVAALARLEATGWVKQSGAPVGKWPPGSFSVRYPTALLTDSRLSPRAKVLFGQLQALGPDRRRTGVFTYHDLSGRLGTGRDTLRAAAAELVRSGWLILEQQSRKAAIHFTLGNPAWADDPVALVRQRLKRGHKGEAIMREYLSLLVDTVRCEDDAAPWFQVNPFTGEHMELDRYYESEKVAFEFQGAQHYDETDLASWTDVVKQVGRDAMKARICRRYQIQLVTVHADDLSLEGMRAKVGSLLPLRTLTDEDGPVMRLLGNAAAAYRANSPSFEVR